ncbi:YkvA family protein [Methanomassiliicoccus luminyensis]|uniref:YkvA family protein n=1 Tax=Methanomassiliicoccus luminyensis TaxID=1080712 RepID=UPI00035D55E2|nr:YkvA family protein [Methanomassiliicoccus luminyensis]
MTRDGSVPLKERAGQLRTDLPAVFLALKKKETPVLAKICAGATVAYALSPVDLIPDFIPVLGYLDDLIVLPALVALTMKLIPRDVLARCRDESAEMWRDGRPKRWRYALPIIALWLIVLYLIAKAIWL